MTPTKSREPRAVPDGHDGDDGRDGSDGADGSVGPGGHDGNPQNVIVILLDSLNRHMLGAYGGGEFETPNLDQFARRSTRFENHFVGSLPCIPARHDILTGSLDFLWRPWGSIELWERSVVWHLRKAGVTSKLVSDHPHLFETGGENYHTDFSAWDYQRGHESDPWRTRADTSWLGAPSFGRGHTAYDDSRGWFGGESDFPGPRTMESAARWITQESAEADRFFLFIDEFDPHEPFDTPEPYASMYDDSWEGPHLIWPPYVVGGVERGILTQDEARQVRASYGGKLTMIDHWFGKLIAAIDRAGLFDSTAVIVCTDHGHYLGERDTWGKPASPLFEPIAHTPLMIAWPGMEGGDSSQALTTNVDIFATVCDIFGITDQVQHRVHGRSLVPLLTGTADRIRDWALAGVWGREVHLIAAGSPVGAPGDSGAPVKYVRAPQGANAPLSLWSNRWSTMPVHRFPELGLPPPDGRAELDNMPGSSIPVIRQPFGIGDPLPFWAMGKFTGNHLYALGEDPSEDENRSANGSGPESPLEREMIEFLRHAFDEVEAPDDQYERLGLA